MPWDTRGNSNTNPPADFLGTTDNRSLSIKVNNSEAVRVHSEPNVSRVEIFAQDGLSVTGFQPFITLRDANANNARSFVQGVNGDIVLIPNSFAGVGAAMVLKTNSGNVGIGTSEPAARLHVVGDVHVTGDIRLTNADCAEEFEVCKDEDIEPGTVMILSDEGILRPCRQAYDKRVAGVISGAGDHKPGIVLDNRGQQNNRKSVALLGKTFCKVDARYAPIEVGDLLTTSESPGHAMKAMDPVRAFGSIIGKAIRPFKEGQGLIPILIALQ